MTVCEALIAVSEGRYQDIPECKAKEESLSVVSSKGQRYVRRILVESLELLPHKMG